MPSDRPRPQEGVPDAGRVRRGEEELEAVLARVPGARDQAVDAAHGRREEAVVAQGREIGAAERLQRHLRGGPLERDHRLIVGDVLHRGVEATLLVPAARPTRGRCRAPSR